MLNRLQILYYKYITSTEQYSPKTVKMMRQTSMVIMVMRTIGCRKNGHRSCSVSSISGSPTPPQCRFSKSSTYGSRDANLTYLLGTDITCESTSSRSDEDILCTWYSSIWPSPHSNIKISINCYINICVWVTIPCLCWIPLLHSLQYLFYNMTPKEYNNQTWEENSKWSYKFSRNPCSLYPLVKLWNNDP